MRSLILFLCFISISISSCFGQLKSKTDERIELTSIVARLTQMNEYINNDLFTYINEIDDYFNPYKEHPVIEYLTELRLNYDLAYSAVAGSATFLSIKNGSVKVNPNASMSELPGIGSRWTEQTFAKYVNLLDDFYKETKFREFFNSHQGIYKLAEEKLNAVISTVNIQWFEDFYGKKFFMPNIYVALCNGYHNYYIQDNDAESEYAIVIGCRSYGDGLPSFIDIMTLPVIIHEISHDFTSNLIAEHWNEMENASNIIYYRVRDRMSQIAYGSANESIAEWLTNLFVLMYLKDNIEITDYFTFMAAQYTQQGFIWMPRSIQYLSNFYTNREIYKHIDSFMPQIVGFLNFTASEYDKVIFEYENRHPYVTNIYPALNGNTIDPNDLTEIKITFSLPMTTDIYGLLKVEDNADVILIPRDNMYWENDRTFVISLKKNALKHDMEYGFQIDGKWLQSKDRYPVIKKAVLFRTSTK